jgi:hypothetical protein
MAGLLFFDFKACFFGLSNYCLNLVQRKSLATNGVAIDKINGSVSDAFGAASSGHKVAVFAGQIFTFYDQAHFVTDMDFHGIPLGWSINVITDYQTA